MRLAQVITDKPAVTGDLVRKVVANVSKDPLVSDPVFKIEVTISEFIDDTRASACCAPS